MNNFDITDAYIQALIESNIYKYKKPTSEIKTTKITERKKYWPAEYHTYNIDGHDFTFKCQYYEVSGSNQASLWGHDVELRMDGNSISSFVVPYYNRTWETFKFQTAMLGALGKYRDAVKNQLFDKARETNNTRTLKQDTKNDILENNEWYQMVQKLYNEINKGNKGIVEN